MEEQVLENEEDRSGLLERQTRGNWIPEDAVRLRLIGRIEAAR